MLAQVNLRVTGEEGLSIPVAAVLIKDGKRRVVYVERPDGTFEAREVQTGRNRDGRRGDPAGPHAGRKDRGARRAAAGYPGRAAALAMLRLLIETCVHRRVAAFFATLVVAAFGVHAYLETPDRSLSGRHQHPGHGDHAAARPCARGNRAAGHGAARAGAERHAGHDADAQREPVRPVAHHADVLRRRRELSRRAPSSCSGSPPPTLPPGADPELAPEATPLGEVYQFRIASDRHDLYQLRSEMQWNVVRVLRQAPGVADIVPFGGYPEGVPRRGRRRAPVRARPDAGRPRAGARQVQRQRRRRLPAPRRPGAHGARRSATSSRPRTSSASC